MSGREKLKQLGIELPLLPITAVGSYAKPEALTKARARFVKGDITKDELRKYQEEATELWMGFQNEIGVDVPVDGEMYRTDMVEFFAEEMDGFEPGGWVRSYGNRYYRKPIITSEVRWRGPMTVDWWRFAQSLTDQPVKGMFTGGYTVMDWSFNEHYPDRKATALALAREFRKEVEALVEAGCKIIQVDEPAVSVRADEIDIAIEAMQITTEGVDAYFITHALEYGYPETVFPDVLALAVDNFDMEFANSDFTFLEGLRNFGFDKDLSLGVVDVHTHVIDSVDDVEQRIRKAIEILPVETIWPDPDCGLKTRTVEESMGKMRAIAEATNAFGQISRAVSDRPLAGQVAIVTGSSRGMGRGTAAHLASLGASVAVCYVRNKDMAEELADDIRKAGGDTDAFGADLTTEDGASSLISAVVDRFGSLSILVCNVGGFLRKPFEETTVEEWRDQFAQNTDTMFFCIREALPHFKAKGLGRIVNFAAAGAEFPSRQSNFAAYAAAKAAVVGFSRALARELGPVGVTVNVIAPGIVSDKAPTREEAHAIGHVKHTPVGRVGSFQDVAEAVAFLVRPEADYITGAVLEVGGGWRV